MYRGITKEGKVVEGYYFKAKRGEHFIIPEDDFFKMAHHGIVLIGSLFMAEVLPTSLAMYTGIKDKYKVRIWGSFEVDGVMSEGGDDVKWWPEDYNWDDYCDDLDKETTGRVVWYKSAGRWALDCGGAIYWPKDTDFFGVEVIPQETENG